MKKRVLLSAMILVAAFPAQAVAAPPANPSCWGAGASDLGRSHAMGDHASSFDEPRLGIGNVAYAFTGTHQPGDLAAALGFTCQ